MSGSSGITHAKVVVPDCSVSFMAEFHEVWCPEDIGRVAGFGISRSGLVLSLPPTYVGEES